MSDDNPPSTERERSDDPYALDELLGAYALDALEGEERERVEDYLRINPRAAEEVRQHREVATMLAFTGMDAPEGVWARIEQEIEGAAPEPGPELARVLAGSSGSETVERSATVHPIRRRWVVPLLAAAAAVVLVAAAGVVVLRNDDGGGEPIADAYADASADDRSLRTELVSDDDDAVVVGVIDREGHGYLDAAQLPVLDSTLTYQLWGVMADNGDVVSLGVLGASPGLETFTVDSDVEALAVTIETSPGVISDGNPDGAFVGAF